MKIENLDEELAKLTISDFDYVQAVTDLHKHVSTEEEELKRRLRDVDWMRTDLLHVLEMEPLNAPKRIQVANALHKVLLKRREIKDRADLIVELKSALKPLESPLRGAVTGSKKIKENHERIIKARTYSFRKLHVSETKASFHNTVKIAKKEEPKAPEDKFYDRYKGRHPVDNPKSLKEVVSK